MLSEQILSPAADENWWRGAVIYQIYPRSFQDSDGDGIGDLAGIIERLPYIARLGVDAIWISPFFTSPMKDYGYDVSDYRDVDPMFGTLDDFDQLVATAHRLGLRVMIDLVLSHSSDQHPWFVESKADRENPKSDWYVWADPKPDGTAPNNWLSIFGGGAWTWDAKRLQYYLHNFLSSQPDLNLHCEDVQTALLDVARFWLDRDVDGFRLDTINFYFCDQELRDNPPLAPELRNDSIAPAVNPYNHQDHVYDKNRPENLAFLKRLRSVMDEYKGRSALGEVGDAQRGMEIMGEYTSGDDKVQMCYAFEFLSKDMPTASRIQDVLTKQAEVAAEGWACWAFSNHDVERHATRWGLSADALRTYATLLHCLRGSVTIYQGEELGFTEADVGFDDLQDPYGKEFWPEFKGRDGCRTPIAWTSDGSHGGFSTTVPWLPISDDHVVHSAASQENDSTSTLAHYRDVIKLRRSRPELSVGDINNLDVDGNILSFERSFEGKTILCVFNLGDEPVTANLRFGNWSLLDVPSGATEMDQNSVALAGWQAALLEN